MIDKCADEKYFGYAHYQPILQTLVDLLKERLGTSLRSVVLYGSVARNRAKKESDIDLLIILDNPPSAYHKRLKPLIEVQEDLLKEETSLKKSIGNYTPYFSYLILSKEEAQENRYVFLDMVEESIILFDRDNFFKNRLEEMKRHLEILGSRRIFLKDGTWYWDLKPDLSIGEVFEL